MKNLIDEYVDTLTDEEKEQFKDLIDETRKREKELDKSFSNIKSDLTEFFNSFEMIFKGLEVLNKSVRDTNEALSKAVEDIKEKNNKMILENFTEEDITKH